MNGAWTKALLLHALRAANIRAENQNLYPVVVKSGINDEGKQIRYYLNYSPETKYVPCRFPAGEELLTGKQLCQNEKIELSPWGTAIVEI